MLGAVVYDRGEIRAYLWGSALRADTSKFCTCQRAQAKGLRR